MMTVYEIRNKRTGRRYVGCTFYFKERVKQHIHNLKKQMHPSFFMQIDFNKYGLDSFTYKPIKEFNSDSRAKLFELKEIEKSRRSYNYYGRSWKEKLRIDIFREILANKQSRTTLAS